MFESVRTNEKMKKNSNVLGKNGRITLEIKMDVSKTFGNKNGRIKKLCRK